ncbi:MAG: hypothetical protein AAFX01_04230 [Cyanobacteria bacterium J06638_28]
MMITNPASQVIAALLVGLLTIFTCQLLLTNVGIALGITIWGGVPWSQDSDNDAKESIGDDESSGIDLGALSIAAGLGLLFTVNGLLFVACYVAVKFCTPMTAVAGGILGWIIWSAYMLVMTWISTRAANSLIAFILSSAVSGLRQIFAVLGSLMQSALDDQEAPLTPASAAELVRQETQLALESIDIPALIEEYIDEQMPPQLQLEALQPQLADTLQKSDLGRTEQAGFLPPINQTTFMQWVRDEIGLSGDIADTIAHLLDQVWQSLFSSNASPWQQLQDLFSTASVNEFLPERVSQLLAYLQPENSPDADSSVPQGTNPSVNSKNTPIASSLGHRLKQILRQRLDLTDLDLQTIWRQVGPLLQDRQPNENISPRLSNQIIHEDVDDYLQQVFPWRLNHDSLQQEFREILVDPEAAADQVLPQLQALKTADFAESLQQRGDLSPEQIDAYAANLEAIRQQAIADLRHLIIAEQEGDAVGESKTDRPNEALQLSDEQTEAIADAQKKLANYLRYTSLSQITLETIAHKVETLVQESSLPAGQLRQASPYLPVESLAEVLDSRRGLEPAQRNQMMQQVQEAWQTYTDSDDGSINAKIVIAVEGVLILTVSQIASHHLDTQNRLPQLMESLESVASDPQDLRRSLSQIDWQALQAKAQTQLDVSEAKIEQALQQVQLVLGDFLKPPKRWALRRSAEVKDFWHNVTDYLNDSHPEQLTPDAMRHNLEWLWRVANESLVPSQSLQATIAEVTRADWRTLKQTLARRQDLATDQIEAIWETLEQFVQSLIHHANEAREQAQASMATWLASVKAILQDSEHFAFDPNRLKADLRALLQNPPDLFATLIQPLKLLDTAEDSVSAIAELSQNALKQLLTAQGVPKILLTQAEGLQTWIRARVVAMEQELQHRQAMLKQAALQQLNEGRKALAIAAWWLFAIAVTSGTTATAAGILAVTGFDAVWRDVTFPW